MLTLRIIILSIACCLTTGSALAKDATPWNFPEKILEALKHAEYWAGRDRWVDALLHAQKAGDPLLEDIYRWRKYIAGSKYITYNELKDFLTRRPDWPLANILHTRIEYMLPENASTRHILNWFTERIDADGSLHFREPVTALGKQLLAEARLALGDHQKAHEKPADNEDITRLLRESWKEQPIGSKSEKIFRERHGKYLRAEDHFSRTSALLWKKHTAAAQRMLPLVEKAERKLFKARIALQTSQFGVDEIVQDVPPRFRKNAGFLYDRAMWRKRHHRRPDILSIAEELPRVHERPDKWWPLLQPLIRKQLANKNYARAYKLASHHGFTDDTSGFASGEWLAGWIALRNLNDPRSAYRHFYRISQRVKSPISIARSGYWAGRAAERNKNTELAAQWYGVAAAYPLTFYGQLAASALGRSHITLPENPTPDATTRKLYRESALMQAAALLNHVDNRKLAGQFTAQAARNAKTPELAYLITQFGQDVGRPQYGVLAAKQISWNTSRFFLDTGYPTRSSLNDSRGRRITEPEIPLIHAIIRQESLFDRTAKSPAGARGLMQLMPRTAKSEARKARLKYSKSKLTADPTFNITLGSQYLSTLVNSYGGSYVLAIASYNAGPGNVGKWIKTIGDPRKYTNPEEVVDWIESIPFRETRNYVMRVLENIQAYRTILGSSPQKGQIHTQLIRDLTR